MRTRWMIAPAFVLAACSGGEAEKTTVVLQGPPVIEPGAAGQEPGGSAQGPGEEGASSGDAPGTAGLPSAEAPAGAPGDEEAGPSDAPEGPVAGPVDEPADEPGSTPDPAGAPPGLVAHEWGTFTSMQGSDGVALLGMHHEEEPLPEFVVSRSNLPLQRKGIESVSEGVDQKLETPVLYFYSDVATDVTVDVSFPQGIIGQWFPDATAWSPPIGGIEHVAGGSMTWAVTVDPAIDPASFPPVDPQDIWAPSRATAATPLRFGDQHERFIFYRGLGRFDMPVRVTSDAAGAVHVTNESADPIPAVILLRTDGATGAVVDLGALGAGQTVSHAASVGEACDDWLACVRPVVVGALVKSGLYQDEAQAMVGTWTRSYFQTPGLRVLYVMPRAWTDALLPIKIDPVPTELVRTLVGRIEVLTPAEEATLVSLVWGALDQPELLAAQLGRFAEPRLRRSCALIDDPKVTSWCDELLLSLSLQP